VGYYLQLKKDIKNYKVGSKEYDKLKKLIDSYEEYRDNNKGPQYVKEIPPYRLEILVKRLDKTIQQIKDCEPEDKRLKGLKEKKRLLELKLKQ